MWEYKIICDHNEKILNTLGEQGWELVSVCQTQDKVYNSVFYKTLYFKRQLNAPATDTGE